MVLLPSRSNRRIATNCHDTALCLIPPQHLWSSVERLRCRYDAAYEKWPPHINLIYPFVSAHDLQAASESIVRCLESEATPRGSRGLDIVLDAVSYLRHKHSNTLYLHDHDPDRTMTLVQLRSSILRALGQDDASSYAMHMSVGQTTDAESDSHKFLMEKLSRLPPVRWEAGHLVVLAGNRSHGGSSVMRFWAAIDLQQAQLVQEASVVGLYEDRESIRRVGGETQAPNQAYTYSQSDGLWKPTPSQGLNFSMDSPENLVIASYNVLAEFTSPPSQARYPLLLDNLLTTTAAADILVLQEVTDDFLIYLLASDKLRHRYSYVTHGPPDQEDLGPLPSLSNQVVLSSIPFGWYPLPLKRQHKISLIATFPKLAKQQDNELYPLVLATCHLTRGLTDGAVSAKKGELQRIVEHLQHNYKDSPWVVAGDFNLATSRYTINAALRKGSISRQTVDQIHSIDDMLFNSGLRDAWVSARCEVGESSDEFRCPKDLWQRHEGEQGATFDPIENELAAELVGTGLGNRPQRYDRILAKADDAFHVAGFSMFGFPISEALRHRSDVLLGSDHWGVRCLLRFGDMKPSMNLFPKAIPVAPRRAPEGLGDPDELKEYLMKIGSFPSEDDEVVRTRALETLEAAILNSIQPRITYENGDERRGPALVVTPVGSYGLGVWSRDSDIDCLCIGPFSSRTFFSVVTRYLRATEGIRVLRKVKANTGAMLELDVGGVRMDLQYCGSASIAEQWPVVMKRPTTDLVFALPSLTLLKLKPARDLAYLRRSIPDLSQFRLAYLLVKTWAKERGIYAARFGYLGGIHISSLLVPVCKMLLQSGGSVSVSDVIVTFFHHYAHFDWKAHVVFDPYFHKRLRYVRTTREPICLLGWHGPTLNTAFAASFPTMKTIATQFQAASEYLGRDAVTWSTLLGLPDHWASEGKYTPGRVGAAEFLQSFRSYVRLDAHYWGLSRERRNGFVGWLSSRCVSVLVDIDRKLPELVARIWPTMFCEASNGENHDGDNMEYRGCFLIGLEWNEDRRDARSKPASEASEGILIEVLRHFEQRIRSDENYYDSKTSWMAATIVRGNELGDLELDLNKWEEVGDFSDDDDSESEDDSYGSATEAEDLTGQGAISTTGVKQAKVGRRPGAGKFRPAVDVMNRLRWDDNMDSGDFLVGYEDRFAGIKEKVLREWKSEQTDDEFIPQHRIAYFRRRSDGVVVWDRAARIDLLFGSG